MDDQTFRRHMALLFATYPERATNREDMQLVSSIYRQALDDLSEVELATAVAAHIRASKWFPKPAELRELARPVRQASAHPEGDFDLIRAQAGSQRDPGMYLLPERATDDDTFTRRRLMRDDPDAFREMVQAEIRAAAAELRIGEQMRAAGYRGRRHYGQRTEAEALLASLRQRRQEEQ